MRKINPFLRSLIVTAALATPAFSQSFLTNQLAAYYPFNGNANDASTNGYNGTVHGATLTTNRFGTPNAAYAFNGAQNYISIPENIFNPSNSAITISVWVTTDANSYANTEYIFDKSSVNGEMAIYSSANQFEFGVSLSNPRTGISVSAALSSSCVTHLVCVYQQGQGIWLYTNGVLASSLTGIPNSTLWKDPSGYPLASAIGIYDYTPGPFDAFHGVIDDIRVYTRALSTAEVQQLYQYESGFSVSVGLYPGVTFSGFVGTSYMIQRNPDLANSNGWTTVANVSLTQPVQLWVDTNINSTLPTNPHYFYRVLPGP
jgi:hypothetical protein